MTRFITVALSSYYYRVIVALLLYIARYALRVIRYILYIINYVARYMQYISRNIKII
jgi:hypothetical protein